MAVDRRRLQTSRVPFYLRPGPHQAGVEAGRRTHEGGPARSPRHDTREMRKPGGGPGVTSPKSQPSGCSADHAGNGSTCTRQVHHALANRFLLSSRVTFGVEDKR